jgi:hypothetical protein
MNKNKLLINSNIWAIAGYLVITLILTFPLWLNINQWIWGDFAFSDIYGTIWVHWLVKESVLNFDLKSIWHTDLIFYPVGKYVLLDIGNALTPLLGIPFQLLFGFPAYHNLICLLILILNGFSMYLLINYIVKNKIVAFFSGLIFGYSPYILNQINCGDIEQAILFWMVLYILYLLKMPNKRPLRNGLLAGLFLSITSLSYWFYGMFLVFFTVIFLLYYLSFNRPFIFNSSFAKGFAGLILLSFLLVIPFTLPYLRGMYTCSVSWLSSFPALSQFKAGGLPDYFYSIIGSSRKIHPPFLLSKYFENFFFLKLFFMFFPFLTSMRKKAILWLFSASFFYILSLGPYLQYSSSNQLPFLKAGLPLPYLFFYKYVPFFSRLWWLDRFSSMGIISITVLYGISFLWFFKKIGRGKKKIFFLGLVTALLILEGFLHKYVFPLKFSNIYVPVYYKELKTRKECAIIELPIYYSGQKNLYYQTIHQKRTLSGMGMTRGSDFLLPQGFKEFMEENSFIKFLSNLPSSKKIQYKKEDVEALRRLGYKYIVVNAEYFRNQPQPLESYEKTNEVLKQIFGNPEIYPDNIKVYRLQEDK